MTDLSGAMGKDYTEFWAFVMDRLHATNLDFLSRRKPSKDSFMLAGTGIPGIRYAIAASRRGGWAKVEISIQCQEDESRWRLDKLKERCESIEADFGHPLEWVDNRNGQNVQRCRIAHTERFDVEDREHWPQIADWFVVFVPRMQRAFHELITRFGSLLPPTPGTF